jgi:anti-sigma factor RsiW
MTDPQTPDEFDDELLSAYLDDELSADERARVEERLAADPAARQTLEQLRAVSRAVQGLPQESLGEDLRGAVLQRAERAMLAPSPARLHEPSIDGDVQPLPRLTIGRSTRGWVWAGLAVAAALLIMVVQREEEHGEALPDVAVARRADDAAGRLAHGNAEMRALPEGPAPATAPVGEAAARRSMASVEPAPVSAPASATPPPEPPMESPAVSDFGVARNDVGDGLHLGLEPESPASEPGGPPPRPGSRTTRLAGAKPATAGRPAATQPQPADELSAIAPATAENEVLVVHVNVRPAALRSQAFDRLLVSNGIVVEQPPDDDQRAAVSGGVSAGAAIMLRSEADESTAAPQDVDAVLVEAPAAQIERCLADLDADKDTYLGVVIDEASAGDELPARKLASERNWQKYNRGRVPQQQQVEMAPGANAFYDAQVRFDYQGIGGRAAQGSQPSFDKSDDFSAANGRAMRMQTQQRDGRQVVEQLRTRSLAAGERAGRSSAPAGVEEDKARRSGDYAKRETAADTLQVLFVLSTDPASSPAADSNVP